MRDKIGRSCRWIRELKRLTVLPEMMCCWDLTLEKITAMESLFCFNKKKNICMHKLEHDPIIRVLYRHILRFYFSHMAPRPVYKTNYFILNLFHWNTVGRLEAKI